MVQYQGEYLPNNHDVGKVLLVVDSRVTGTTTLVEVMVSFWLEQTESLCKKKSAVIFDLQHVADPPTSLLWGSPCQHCIEDVEISLRWVLMHNTILF